MQGTPLRVLLAEDDSSHAMLIERSLERHGFDIQITRVRDGAEALDYLKRRGSYGEPASSPRPDLVLLDLRMPRVDGLEVLRRIKSDGGLHRLPVVVLTTSDAEGDVARAYDLRANSYLVKPIDFDEFSELMRDLGHYWSRWNKAPRVRNHAS